MLYVSISWIAGSTFFCSKNRIESRMTRMDELREYEFREEVSHRIAQKFTEILATDETRIITDVSYKP